jgi:quercetin 2,3-dioxygenase
MPDTKTVAQILAPPPVHWVGDGFRVHNFFPGGHDIGEQRMSPFYLLDYNSKFQFPPSDKPRGVGPHPHRGFETVTIAFKGKVAHHDSRGSSGVIGEGDIQWMTAGSGILHKEYHEAEFNRTGGDFHMLQLWVNLPAKDKLTTPKYQAILKSQIEKFQLADNKGSVAVIAGEYEGVKGVAHVFSPVEMYYCELKARALLGLTLPSDYNTGLLLLEGSVRINDVEIVPVDHFCLFNNDGTDIQVTALEDARFMLLSGEPLNEPIAAYGPFVMNTPAEIREAMRDFGSGKFGFLE